MRQMRWSGVAMAIVLVAGCAHGSGVGPPLPSPMTSPAAATLPCTMPVNLRVDQGGNREVLGHLALPSGATIDLTGDYDVNTRLFSESPSRIIISFDESVLGDIEVIVAAAGCPMTLLGNVGADRLRIESDGEEVVQLDVAEMESAWRSSLKEKLQAEVLAAGAE